MAFESLIFLLVAFFIAFPFLFTMNRCLEQMAPESRRISQSQLWLNLIPAFNLIWTFVSARRFAQSMAAEKQRRRPTADVTHGDKGLITAALFAGFMVTLPFSAWNWLLFAAWMLALALYWKDIALDILWLTQNRPPRET